MKKKRCRRLCREGFRIIEFIIFFMNNIYFGFDVEFISVKYNFFFDLGNVFGGILRFVVEDN